MTLSPRILYLEPSPEAVAQVRAALAQAGLPCELFWVNSREGFEQALTEAWRYDLLLAACQNGGLEAGAILELARQRAPDVPLVYLAGELEAERITGYLALGARDQAPKGDPARLGPVVRKALEEARHRAGEQTALAAKARLATLLGATLDATSDGVLVTDLAGRISVYNRKFLSLCGIPEYLMATMELEKVLQFLADHFQSPELLLNESRLLTASPEQESSRLLKGEDGRTLKQSGRPHRVGAQTVGRVFSLSEVSPRELGTVQPRTFSGGVQQLLDAAEAGEVVLWTLTQDRLFLSDYARTLLGPGIEDGATSLAELEARFHPEDLDRFHWALEHPEHARFEARLRRDDQAWVWTRWTLDRLVAGSWHGVFREVGEARARQEQLAERQRLEWTAGLGLSLVHELARPIQLLRSGLEALAAGGPTPGFLTCAKAAAGFEAILARLTGAPLTDAGLALRLNELVDRLGPWAEAALPSGIRMLTELQPGLPALPLHPARFEPVLMNLLLNARDALGGTGLITVRTGAVRGDPEAPSDPAAQFLEVADNGPGIAPRILEHIFEPGFTTRPRASGLGLAVVRSVVEGCGGSIQVDTGAMRGTRIRILLPAGAPRRPS